MKYIQLFNSVKQSRGIPDKDDARLLADVNMVRHDIVRSAPWREYSRSLEGNYSAGGFAVPDRMAGVVAVSASGSFFYFGDRNFVPSNLGFSIWEFVLDSNTWRIRLFNESGHEIPTATPFAVLYWTFPVDMNQAALSTEDYEFASTAPFISALHGRWLRYHEGRPDEAGQFESLYDRQISGMIALNPRPALPPPVSRGGTTYFPGYAMMG
jgi:hypothetical protein